MVPPPRSQALLSELRRTLATCPPLPLSGTVGHKISVLVISNLQQQALDHATPLLMCYPSEGSVTACRHCMVPRFVFGAHVQPDRLGKPFLTVTMSTATCNGPCGGAAQESPLPPNSEWTIRRHSSAPPLGQQVGCTVHCACTPFFPVQLGTLWTAGGPHSPLLTASSNNSSTAAAHYQCAVQTQGQPYLLYRQKFAKLQWLHSPV